MVRYWRRVRDPGWHYRAVVNGVGATATGIVTRSRGRHEVRGRRLDRDVAIPGLVLAVLRHPPPLPWRRAPVARRCGSRDRRTAAATNTALLLVESIDEATVDALWFVRSTTDGRLPGDPRSAAVGATRRSSRAGFVRRRAISSRVLDGRSGFNDAVLEQVWRLPRGESDFVTVVIPELFRRRRSSTSETPARAAAQATPALGARRRRGRRSRAQRADGGTPRTPWSAFSSPVCTPPRCAPSTTRRHSDVADTRAINFAFSAEEGDAIRRDWLEHGPDPTRRR